MLATVKGDIHDIGKNIVKVLLENYGYTVVDLGKDVDPAAVVEAVRKHRAPLVGLSALMTTTLKSMADTIALLHLEGLPCKIMVGGAVLTPEYASQNPGGLLRPGRQGERGHRQAGHRVTTAMGPGGAVKPSSRPFCAAYRQEKGLTAPIPLRVSQGSAILRTERRRRP